MKRFILITVLALLVGALLAPPASAQQTMNPNGQTFFYTYSLAKTKTYTNSQTDTLPAPNVPGRLNAQDSVFLGGANFVSLKLRGRDSTNADVYVDERACDSTGTWATIKTDSLINTSNDAGVVKEYLLRTMATEVFTGMYKAIRVRIAWRATKNGTTSANYDATVLWKP